MLDRKRASGKAVSCILTCVRSLIKLMGVPVPCINYLQWTSVNQSFQPPSLSLSPQTFLSNQVKENWNNCICWYVISHHNSLTRNKNFLINHLPAVKRISCWVDTANKISLPEGMTMSESQKEYKTSRLKYSLTNTESLQVFHLEKTLAHSIRLGLFFYTEVPAKSKESKKPPTFPTLTPWSSASLSV